MNLRSRVKGLPVQLKSRINTIPLLLSRVIHNALYSFVVLVIISCVTSFLAVMVSLKAIHDNGQKFCQIVGSVTATPAVRPSSPGADPSRERSYEIYEEFVKLHNDLGCP